MRRMLFGCLVLFGMAGTADARDGVDADILLASGRILDGTGAAPVEGDVAIRGDRIVAVGRFPVGTVGWRIDCSGLTVAPGFIDLHNHSDSQVVRRETRSVVNYLTQGCTTIVTGNCGFGPIDVAGYATRVEAAGIGPNVAHLVPHGSLRETAVGKEQRPASAAELAEMRQLADQAMQDGAWGMSTGLIYVPGSFSDTQELTSLAEVVARHGGIYASHMRSEGRGLLGAVRELLQIGRDSGAAVHISHFKSSGQPAWGLIREAARTVEAARASGLTVTADQYPYIASSTSLRATLVPRSARSGGREAMVARLKNPDTRAALLAAIQDALADRDDGERIQVARFRDRPHWAGRRLTDIAADEQSTPLDVVEYMLTHGGASIVNFSMREEDVRFAMRLPWVATASDGRAYVPGGDRPHPRNYGTFPRKIGHYAVREQVVSEVQAVRSATSLPAQILGLHDRGRIAPNLMADVVVYDAERLIDRATFADPHRYSVGVRYVFVNGRAAVHDGTPTGQRAGRFLRHASKVAQ